MDGGAVRPLYPNIERRPTTGWGNERLGSQNARHWARNMTRTPCKYMCNDQGKGRMHAAC